MENGHSVTKEEVIAKLKDDGDFDRLRLKIVRRLKDNVSCALPSLPLPPLPVPMWGFLTRFTSQISQG